MIKQTHQISRNKQRRNPPELDHFPSQVQVTEVLIRCGRSQQQGASSHVDALNQNKVLHLCRTAAFVSAFYHPLNVGASLNATPRKKNSLKILFSCEGDFFCHHFFLLIEEKRAENTQTDENKRKLHRGEFNNLDEIVFFMQEKIQSLMKLHIVIIFCSCLKRHILDVKWCIQVLSELL